MTKQDPESTTPEEALDFHAVVSLTPEALDLHPTNLREMIRHEVEGMGRDLIFQIEAELELRGLTT